MRLPLWWQKHWSCAVCSPAWRAAFSSHAARKKGDTISVRRGGIDDVIVTTNGVNQTFDMDNFTGVRLEGLGGNDTFNLIDALLTVSADDERHVTVLGGPGTDTVSYATRKNGLTFRRYEDDGFLSVTVNERGDRVDAAVERFVGGLADDRFEVDDRDHVLANPPEVTLEGGAGLDTFRPAYFMRATIRGGAGDDRFGVDDNVLRPSISAGDGNDEVRLLNGGMPSVLDAGPGLDTMLASESTAAVIDMRPFAGLEDLRGAGTPAVEVFGNALDNQIISLLEGQRITVHGLGGDDTIVGTNGPDSLDGGEGDDILVGKDGNDTLDGGGAGMDT